MPDNEVELKPQKRIEYRTPPEGIFHAYSNNVQMATTSFDVKVIFGEVAEVLEDKVMIDQRVQVTMSWVEAKLLADFLRVNIEAHEALNGPLKLPRNPEKIIVPETFPSPK